MMFLMMREIYKDFVKQPWALSPCPLAVNYINYIGAKWLMDGANNLVPFVLWFYWNLLEALGGPTASFAGNR